MPSPLLIFGSNADEIETRYVSEFEIRATKIVRVGAALRITHDIL